MTTGSDAGAETWGGWLFFLAFFLLSLPSTSLSNARKGNVPGARLGRLLGQGGFGWGGLGHAWVAGYRQQGRWPRTAGLRVTLGLNAAMAAARTGNETSAAVGTERAARRPGGHGGAAQG